MKIRRKHVLIVAVFAIICIMIITSIIIKRYNKDIQEIAQKEKENTIEFSELCYDNGWSKTYVNEIKDETPIPAGYEYVQGDIDTGLIIKNAQESYYMWIPYAEDAYVNNIDDYFPTSNQIDISYEQTMSMIDYGGFYISLTTENDEVNRLKNFTAEQYENEKKLIEENNTGDSSVNTHLISKRELEQVLFYVQSKNINGINLGNAFAPPPGMEGNPNGGQPPEMPGNPEQGQMPSGR